MKKSMSKVLALLLTVIMVLGAVPFAAAADPSIVVTANKTNVWPGETVVLKMEASEGTSSVRWDNGEVTNSISYTVPGDATGTDTVGVTVKFGTSSNEVTVTDSVTLNINTPAGSDFAVSGNKASVKVGESASFSCTGENDSDVTYSVSGEGAAISANGRFTASAAGNYIVTATAKNGPAAGDDVTASTSIEVTEAAYKVNLSNLTVKMTQGTGMLKYTVTDAEGNDAAGYTTSFRVDDASIASVADDGFVTANKAGKTDVTLTVTIDGETYTADAVITVTDKGAITCSQDGGEFSGGSAKMTFVLQDVNTDEVHWTVSVPDDFSVSEESFTSGTTASVNVESDDGIGVATVKVTASWGSSSASGTFTISFYARNSYTVVLDEGVDEFRFDENGVFKSVSGSNTNASKKSLHSLITDGYGNRVELSEGSSMNDRVGEITRDTGSTFAQYDPDDVNDYSLIALEELVFEVKGSGEYELDFKVYDQSSRLATSMGTITIVTGDMASDIEYTCSTGGTITFDADDFEEFWEDQEDDEDLAYVTFSVATSTDTYGTLYIDGKEVKSTWKFYADPTKSQYGLDDVTYKASTVQKKYTDSFTFVCVGEDGAKISGVAVVDVKSNSVAFNDVSSSDWFYDEVVYVCTNGIMNGTSDTTFAPNSTLTRGMVVTMLYRIEREPATSNSGTFSDVPTGQWYSEAVEWAAKHNIVNGVGNGKFAPNTAITREQLATILYRYTTEYKGKSVKSGSLSSFSDADKVADFAKSAMEWAVGTGIITGDNGKLMPQGNATRAQAAAMFARFMKDDGSRNNSEKEEEIAYVVGNKYHLDEDCAGRSANEKKLSVAEKNYDPCTKCVDDEDIAYVVGNKYHLDEDCAGRTATAKSLSTAERNYDPCSRCVD